MGRAIQLSDTWHSALIGDLQRLHLLADEEANDALPKPSIMPATNYNHLDAQTSGV